MICLPAFTAKENCRIVAVPLDLFPTGKWDFTHGKSVIACNLYSHSETAHGKSPWIHQKEQKNYPWRFPNQAVGFSLGLFNHKSSSTNRVEEKSNSGNRSTCRRQFSACWNYGKYPGTYQIHYSWHQTWPIFEVHCEYVLIVFALNTH